MEIGFILKIAGVGILINILCQVLSKTGKEDQSNMVSLAGTIIILLIIIGKLADLITKIESVFGIV